MRTVAQIPMEDVKAITELLLMSKEEVEKVEYTPYKCLCAIEGCTRFTTLRNFDTEPFFWSRQLGWVNLQQQKFYCSNHLYIIKQNHVRNY